MMKSAVFFDRDGVLNRCEVRDGRPHPPRHADEVRLLPKVEEACAVLKRAGLVLIVVTNQPDIARGTASLEDVDAINGRLRALLPLDEIAVCPHDDDDDCPCRKPRPGLVVDSAATWGIDLATSVLVGDRWRDIEAGRAAGVATVFIDRGYAERRPLGSDIVVSELHAAVPFVLDRARRGGPLS